MCLLFIFDLLYMFVVYISDQRGWWFSRLDDYYNAGDPSDCCKGYKESLDVIVQTFQDQVCI